MKFVRFIWGVDVTFLLRNKNVTSTLLMKRTHSIPSPLPLASNRTFKLSPRVEFYAKKAITNEIKRTKKLSRSERVCKVLI